MPMKKITVWQTKARTLTLCDKQKHIHSITALFLAHLTLLLSFRVVLFRGARSMFLRLGFLQHQEQVGVISDAAVSL